MIGKFLDVVVVAIGAVGATSFVLLAGCLISVLIRNF